MKILIKSAMAAIALAISFGNASAKDIRWSTTKVAGDVYRFQNNFHFSLVTVTSAGVVVVNPIHEDAAA